MRGTSIVAAVLLCVVRCASSAAQQRSGPYWFSDVTIVSPEDLDHVSAGNVLIENGKIAAVYRGKNAHAPAGSTVISGKGKFLIPGLIDSHVHLAAVPGVSAQQLPPATIGRYFQQLPRSYLYFGYTTLIDLAVFNRRALDAFRNTPMHPDLYDCGPSLPVANGYPMLYAPAETRFQMYPNWLYDPEHPSNAPQRAELATHTPAATVAAVKASGGICVKTYFERGFGAERGLPVITPSLIAKVREAAHQNGVVLMMHANAFESQKFAVDSDVDVIAHGMWNWPPGSDGAGLPAEIKSVLDLIIEKRIGYQPTIQVMAGGFGAVFDPEYLNMPAVAKVVPADLLAWYKSPQGQSIKQDIREGNAASDDAMRENIEQGPVGRVNLVVAYLASRNARFLFGTDTPSGISYGNLPGLNGYLEMRDLYRAGMSLRQILKAATIENARMFHLDVQVGTIERGKVANLLLLDKSPLETIEAYDSIVTVWLHGRPISRQSLGADDRN
jgi:imidazolonepropionase-like amidohydrolase